MLQPGDRANCPLELKKLSSSTLSREQAGDHASADGEESGGGRTELSGEKTLPERP